MSVTDRDFGYARIIEDLEAMTSEPHVLVGIRQAEGIEVAEGDDLNLATIAAINEFGTDDGRIPSRPFLRQTVDENRDVYAKEMGKAITDQLDGKRTLVEGLELVGLRAVRDVQKKIRNNDFYRNVPSTVAAKRGSTKPLIDTGRLRQSIDFEVGE